MRRSIILATLVALTTVGGALSSLHAEEFEPGIKLITTAELKAALDAGKKLMLVNTLSPIEFRDRAIRGSINIPYEYLRDGKASLPADKDGMLVLYCLNTQCVKSPKAARLAVGKGYKDVHLYREGIAEWMKAGNPIETAEAIPSEKIDVLTPAQFKEAAVDKENTLIIDIRDTESFAAMKLPYTNVLHVEMAYLEERLASIPKNKKLLISCHAGKQGIQGGPFLKRKGFNVIGLLDGGITSWQKSGLPVELAAKSQ